MDLITGIFGKIFGTKNDRIIKKYRAVVDLINGLENDFQALSDEALAAKTDEFKSAFQKMKL